MFRRKHKIHMVFEYCDHTVLNELEAHPRGYALSCYCLVTYWFNKNRWYDISNIMIVMISFFACQICVQHLLNIWNLVRYPIHELSLLFFLKLSSFSVIDWLTSDIFCSSVEEKMVKSIIHQTLQAVNFCHQHKVVM